jgi:hypothetical protein
MRTRLSLAAAGIVALALVACAPSTVGAPRTFPIGAIGTLAAGGASTASGTASFQTLSDNTTRVSVTLTGLEPNSKHAGHIHEGACAAQGRVVVPLDDISADATGNGSMTKTVETAKIPAGGYVQYHQRASNDASGAGAGIACGDIK